MARPILRLALRVNRRTRWTAWAIAFACMVLVGSLTLIDGLSAGVDSVTSRLQTGPFAYLEGQDLLKSAIDPSGLVTLPNGSLALRAHVGQLAINGLTRDAIVASLSTYVNGMWSSTYPAGARDLSIDAGLREEILAASGGSLDGAANLTLFGAAASNLTVVAPPPARPDLLPNDWAWVRPEFLLSMSPQTGDSIQAILTPSPLDPAAVSHLGLSSLPTVGAVGFAQGSVSEARTGLVGLEILIAVVIGLLVYSAMSLEVRARAQEMETLRSVGASPRTVAAIYEGQALLLALLGATLGTTLGIVVANAIVAFAAVFGVPNLVVVEPSLATIAAAFGLSALAAMVGGIVPARQAARRTRRATEARPS